MKNIFLIISSLFFVFSSIAQDKINWMSTSEFEKSISEGNINYFILIQDSPSDKDVKYSERMKKLYSFLDNPNVIEKLNKNFNCYKFDPSQGHISFQGKKYDKIDKKDRSTHEFTSFLTGSERNRLPVFVLRDKGFNLFEYKKSIPDIEGMKVLLEAERLKTKYIIDNLGEKHDISMKSVREIKSQEERLKKNKENKNIFSVFPVRRDARIFMKTLDFFLLEKYKDVDYESYMNKNKKQ